MPEDRIDLPRKVDGRYAEKAANPMDPEKFREALAEQREPLRSFARLLTHNPVMADDLVQDAMVKALANRDRFEAGTNMRSWLFTVLRNHYYSQLRKSRREVQDIEGKLAARLAVRPDAEDRADLEQVRKLLGMLTPDQREAILSDAEGGGSIDEIAEETSSVPGMVKSRLHRGRLFLRAATALLDGDADEEIMRSLEGNADDVRRALNRAKGLLGFPVEEKPKKEKIDKYPVLAQAMRTLRATFARAGFPEFLVFEGDYVRINPLYQEADIRFNPATASLTVSGATIRLNGGINEAILGGVLFADPKKRKQGRGFEALSNALTRKPPTQG